MKLNDLAFFDNLNEYVYAADTQSYEIAYMNKKELERFGFDSIEEAKSKKCHEIMHNCSSPCIGCNNSLLCEGKFIERSIYDPILKTGLVIKDTMITDNGRNYRVEISFDTNSSDWQQNRFLGLEAIVNNGLRISSAEEDADSSINILLEYIGKALNAERTYIFEKKENGCDDNTYEWAAAGVTPEIDNLRDLPPDVCANWYESFNENKIVIIEDLEGIRTSDPIQYENLKRQNIHSLVVIPLFENSKAIGFYGVDNPPVEQLRYAKEMLQIMSLFIVNYLKRRNLMKKLEEISLSDNLTKLGNRHAMQFFVEKSFAGCSCLGVLYCDITGLKRKNDTEGHKSGDKYIIDACECLKEAFDGYGLFRIGGDELLALCPDIEKDDFYNRIKVLREKLKQHKVIMAIGSIYETNGNYDIDNLLNRSETLMYKEKSEYYRAKGIERRH